MMQPIAREQIKFCRYKALGIQLLCATYIKQSFPRHSHNEFVIGFIGSGALRLTYNGGKQVASKGNFYVVNPDVVHAGQAEHKNGWTCTTLYVDSALVQDVTGEIMRSKKDSFFPKMVLRDERLVQPFLKLRLALERMDSLLECESQLMHFLVTLVTFYADSCQSAQSTVRENQSVKRVREYLDAHYAEKILLDDLATVANLSKFYLLRAFNLEVGRPPHAYLEQIRINHAKALLLKGYPISQIAAETGYIDQSHFTNRFKCFMGITPWQFAQSQQ